MTRKDNANFVVFSSFKLVLELTLMRAAINRSTIKFKMQYHELYTASWRGFEFGHEIVVDFVQLVCQIPCLSTKDDLGTMAL